MTQWNITIVCKLIHNYDYEDGMIYRRLRGAKVYVRESF